MTNARIAAKQRRQKILVVVLLAILAALLAWEVPKLLDRSRGDASSAAAPPPAPISHGGPKRAPGVGNGTDPFAPEALPDGDSHAVASGGPDPFNAGSPSDTSSTAALPSRLVIGRPGGDRVGAQGWIVILASIPTGDGRASAVRFAREARGSVGGLSVLNSSSSRPLRGGYWVVYSGPYSTLDAVSRRAGDIHAAGYRSAYIRELVTYQ